MSESPKEILEELICHQCNLTITKGQAYFPDATFFPPKQTKIHEDCLVKKMLDAGMPVFKMLQKLERFRQVRGEEREWTEEDISFAKSLAKDAKKGKT